VHSFPRPDALFLSVERRPADGACPECGASELADYRVLSDGGWWDVRKCQRCLASARREPGPLFGSYVPLGLEIGRPEPGGRERR
jgi:hypothetical protein